MSFLIKSAKWFLILFIAVHICMGIGLFFQHIGFEEYNAGWASGMIFPGVYKFIEHLTK